MPPPKKKRASTAARPYAKNKLKFSPSKNGQKPTSNAVSSAQINIYGYHELAQSHYHKQPWTNALSTSQTFADALSVTNAIKSQLHKLIPKLPRRGSVMYTPSTLSEATSYVNAREDAKKKQAVTRLDGDIVAVPAESYRGRFPGVVEGDGDAAAFWLYTRDFFRDFCVEDACELLAFLKTVEEIDEFGIGDVRARPPELLQSSSPRVITALLDKPVIQPQRRQRRESAKSSRAASYVYSMPGSLSFSPVETAEDVALAQALAASEVSAKEQQQNLPVTCRIITAPKAKLQKLNKALDKLKKIVKLAPDDDTHTSTNNDNMHPWTYKLLHETKIPSHVIHAANEPYYLDPPGSLTQENLANLVKHTEKVSEEVSKFIHAAEENNKTGNEDLSLMAAAPQDELAAETLALQSELAAVMASNRGRLLEPLKSLVDDISVQEKKRKERDQDESFSNKFFGALHKQASTKLPTYSTHSTNPNPPKSHHTLMGEPTSEEAFCAVCADGFSAPPNVILFCDRCDVPVHQACYNIDEIPQHEWLCWPCREHEDGLASRGKTREEIRPTSISLEHRDQLSGGSKDVVCALCPVKGGAFRKTVDGKRWVHQACAAWHPEVGLRKSNECAVVTNLDKIPEERLNNKCSICGDCQGAVVNCPKLGCPNKYHVVCAMKCGLYFSTAGGVKAPKIFCLDHGAAEQEKDSVLLAKRLAGVVPKMTKASQRKEKEEGRKKDLVVLQALEDELSRMQALRVNFEQLRQLLDLSKRREKVKRAYVSACQEAFQERMEDPDAALELLEKLTSYETPAQALSEEFGVSTPVHPTKGIGATTSNLELQLTPGGSVLMADGSALYTLVDERVSKAGRPRRVAATIERERMLTVNEAETLNASLPQGVRYVRL